MDYRPNVTIVVDGVEIPDHYRATVARKIVAIDTAEKGLMRLVWSIDPFDK